MGQSEVPLPHMRMQPKIVHAARGGPHPLAAHHSALPPVILLALSSSSRFIMLSMTTCIQRSVNESVNFQRGFVCMH